jgi:phage terminase large subunit-like protein
MHALTFQERPHMRRTLALKRQGWFPWKWATLTAVFAAGMTWTVSAARTPKVTVTPKATMPKVVSLVVVPVESANEPHESPEALELRRLETRNRRLEALVSVLRARSEEHAQK